MKLHDIRDLLLPQVFDGKKVVDTLEETLNVLKDKKLTVSEIIALVANLSMSLGSAVEQRDLLGISIEELEKEYYLNTNKAGLALYLQGITMSSWLYSRLNQLSDTDQEETKQEDQCSHLSTLSIKE